MATQKSRERAIQEWNLWKKELEQQTTALVIPSVSNKTRADILWMGSGKDAQRFEFSELPGFTGWTAASGDDHWGYFERDKTETWRVFVKRLLSYFEVSGEVKTKIRVMKEQSWLKEWEEKIKGEHH